MTRQSISVPKIIFVILLLLILGIASSILSLLLGNVMDGQQHFDNRSALLIGAIGGSIWSGSVSAPIGGLLVLAYFPDSAFTAVLGISLFLLIPIAAGAGWAGASVLNRMRHRHTVEQAFRLHYKTRLFSKSNGKVT
ncbi:hypothetical protein BDQ17DRAFT_1434029 [Cyathus striatus]|nr:hypothetical protein BDQ17DRAFT_1434029 [Cyathus striatus]